MPAKLVGGFIILFTIASSCSDPSTIGLDLDPNNNQIGVFFVEIPLSASMILTDSLYTTNQGRLVVGGGNSDFFGKTVGIGFSRLAFSPDVARPDEDAILDSVRFNFRVQSVLGNDLTQPKSLSVHLLTEALMDTSYYNFDKLSYSEAKIAQGEFNFSERQDTLVYVPLDQEFSEFVFDELKKGDAFRDLFAFRRLIPGIAVHGDPEQDASINLEVGNNTGMVFFYHNEGDTVSKAYPISTGQSRHFNHVSNDRTGTPTDAILEKNVEYPLDPIIGGKSNLGFIVKIDTSPLDAFLDTLTNVTFNDITFEMGPLENSSDSNGPPPFLEMFFTNETNKILRRSDGSRMSVQDDRQAQQAIDAEGNIVPSTGSPALLFYTAESGVYRQRITSYINTIYRSDLQRNDWLLHPVLRLSTGSTSNELGRDFREYMVRRDNIKLKIFYSKIRAL